MTRASCFAAFFAALSCFSFDRFGFAQSPADLELQSALAQKGFPPAGVLGSSDRQYLRELASDTWNCMASMVDPKSGLPHDTTERGEFTSVSNIGIYLTSVIAARELGLITSSQADERLDAALSSIEKLRTWHGFQQCWNSVLTLQPADHDPAISFLDTGNFAAGLITVSQASPAHHQRCEKLLTQMDWAWVYDPAKGLLRGGFNTKKDAFVADWHVGALATDAQLCQFLAIADGAAPPEMWDRLERATESSLGVTYLQPGWLGGGLFMQYISGMWLDERDTLMGRSAENFAYSQMLRAKEMNSPVWGWSASFGPEGNYLGWAHLKEDVVTPHACVLAIDRFPEQVIANLRVLESLGARPAGKLGFVDSVDWKSRRVSDKYLMLDQGMLFLSLANHLEQGVIRKHVQSHPLVVAGRRKIRAFREPMFKARG